MTKYIEQKAHQASAHIAGRIRYDRSVTLAQMQELAVVETDSPCAADIQSIWKQLGLPEKKSTSIKKHA
jgi:hypothetical protein